MSQPMVPPPPPPAASAPSSNRTLMIILSYLGLLALIPLLVEKDDTEVQWHAKNGLAFTVAFVVLFIALTIIGMLPVAGCLTLIATPFAGLAWLIVSIMGIVKGMNGERFRIPGLSDFADKM